MSDDINIAEFRRNDFMEIAGNTFLVTGGSSGLGAACMRRLAADGANVVIADIDTAAGQALAEELAPQAWFVQTDVTSAASAAEAIESAVSRTGKLVGLINCAGVLAAARVVSRNGPHDLELFRRVVEVNLVGSFNMTRLAAASMCDNPPNADGERGVVINTSSVAAFEGQIGQAAYAASKGGVASMTLPLARDLGSRGIRVAAIAPGVFDTAMMQAAPDQVRQALEAQAIFPPRLGRAEEFAMFALHIIENPMINGAVLRLDGAMRMPPK